MDFDRVKPTNHLKVERAGHRRQRRSPHDEAAEFHELLDEDLEEDAGEDPAAGTPDEGRSPSGDTVSITTGAVPPPLVDDFVSISLQARLSALEAEQAEVNTEQPVPQETDAADPPADTEDGESSGIDTVA